MQGNIKLLIEMPQVLTPKLEKKSLRAFKHDFLAEIPLSPNGIETSDGNLSDLSSSFWSAKISLAEKFPES